MYQLKILRGVGKEKSHWETFESPLSGEDSVARALEELDERPALKNAAGQPAKPVLWDCACLEKKCGACAMVIGGLPRLACATPLSEAADRRGVVTLAPLTKFPRIEDLRVDRDAMFARLEAMHLWLENDAALSEQEQRELHYQAASCLMCGLCLEACPNFDSKHAFAGAAAAAAAFGVLEETNEGAHREEVRRAYRRSVYEGCSKTLACQTVCPAKLPIEKLMVQTNAAAIWKRRSKNKQKKERNNAE